jgi:hypothetical protein
MSWFRMIECDEMTCSTEFMKYENHMILSSNTSTSYDLYLREHIAQVIQHTSMSHVVAIETQGALIASIIVASVCTTIEAVLAHTFSETIGTEVVDEGTMAAAFEWVEVQDVYHQDVYHHDKSTRLSKSAPGAAYTLMQSIHSQTPETSYQTTENKQNSSRRLDTANFLQTMQSYK